MERKIQNRTGAQILVASLLNHYVDKIFCVPGESYLSVLDALYDYRNEISLINANHETGASNMAEAYGKLTGSPGIAFVTRGPGACHASIGVHISKQDSSPMILFIGQVESSLYGKESFQEIDYLSMFSKVAKWTYQISKVDEIEKIIHKAFDTFAESMKPMVSALIHLCTMPCGAGGASKLDGGVQSVFLLTFSRISDSRDDVVLFFFIISPI